MQCAHALDFDGLCSRSASFTEAAQRPPRGRPEAATEAAQRPPMKTYGDAILCISKETLFPPTILLIERKIKLARVFIGGLCGGLCGGLWAASGRPLGGLCEGAAPPKCVQSGFGGVASRQVARRSSYTKGVQSRAELKSQNSNTTLLQFCDHGRGMHVSRVMRD